MPSSDDSSSESENSEETLATVMDVNNDNNVDGEDSGDESSDGDSDDNKDNSDEDDSDDDSSDDDSSDDDSSDDDSNDRSDGSDESSDDEDEQDKQGAPDLKGPKLEAETISYFSEIHKALLGENENRILEDDEDVEMMLNNVYDEIEPVAFRICVNPRCSRALEEIIARSSDLQVRRFFHIIEKLLHLLVIDRCASHVLQALLRRVPAILIREANLSEAESSNNISDDTDKAEKEEKKEEEHKGEAPLFFTDKEGENANQSGSEEDEPNWHKETPSMSKLLYRVCEILQEYWIEYMFSPHASFFLRDLIRVLSGEVDTFAKEAEEVRKQRLREDNHDYLGNDQADEGKFQRKGGKRAGARRNMEDPIDYAKIRFERSYRHLSYNQLSTCLKTMVQSLIACDSAHISEMMFDNTASCTVLQQLLEGLASCRRTDAIITELISVLLRWRVDVDPDQSSEYDPRRIQAAGGNLDHDDSQDQKKTNKADSAVIDPAWGTDQTSQTHVRTMMGNQYASHLMEKILACAPSKVLAHIYNKHFAEELLTLSKAPSSNFVVQKLFALMKDKKTLAAAFKVLKSSFKDLLEHRRAGVVWRLIQSLCLRNVQTKACLQAIARALDINDMSENNDLARRLLLLNIPMDQKPIKRFSLHGSLLLQVFFELKQATCRPVVDSMLALDDETVCDMARNRVASRVLDAFVGSANIRHGHKQKMMEKMQNFIVEIASTPQGSFCLEKCYGWADEAHKTMMLDVIVKNESRLAGLRCGIMLMKKIRVSFYKRRGRPYQIDSAASKRTLESFSDILEGKSSGKRQRQGTRRDSKSFNNNHQNNFGKTDKKTRTGWGSSFRTSRDSRHNRDDRLFSKSSNRVNKRPAQTDRDDRLSLIEPPPSKPKYFTNQAPRQLPKAFSSISSSTTSTATSTATTPTNTSSSPSTSSGSSTRLTRKQKRALRKQKFIERMKRQAEAVEGEPSKKKHKK